MLRKYYKTKYWKYVWEDWTQPVFSSYTASDGSMVSTSYDASAGQEAWRAMDGIIPSSSNTNAEWSASSAQSDWWQVKFPYKLKITGLIHYNMYSTTANNIDLVGRFYTGSDMVTPIGDQISTPKTSSYATTIANIPSEGIVTDTIYFRKTACTAYGGIGELKITATRESGVVESTSSDYGYTTEVEGSPDDYDRYVDII